MNRITHPPSFSFVCSLILFLSFITTAFTSSEYKLNDDPLIRQVVPSDGHGSSGQASQVPCYFVFGDSLFDNGNNNDLLTTAKANYPPYGIDFPEGPNGRFSNGRNAADILAELLGFDDYIPPFASGKGQEILKGVNYASGGAGILDVSGLHLGARLSLDRQLQHHKITVSRIARILRDRNSAANYLQKCLYTVGMGNNDYINNYFMPQFYPTSLLFTPESYADVLIQKYSQQLKTLYNMGARKVAVFGLGAIGCTLYEVAKYGATNGSICVDFINSAVQLFNSKLTSLVDDFNINLPNATFTYINSIGIALTPAPPGLKVNDAFCCEVAIKKDKLQCMPLRMPCMNRNEYVFWDAVHPTEAATLLSTKRAYSALLPSDTHPIDIKHLVQL